MKPRFIFLSYLLVLGYIGNSLSAQNNRTSESEILKLVNPITVEYLNKNLSKDLPRLVLNKKSGENLRKKIKSDPLIKSTYASIKYNAEIVLKKEEGHFC